MVHDIYCCVVMGQRHQLRCVFGEWENPPPGSSAFSWVLPRDLRVEAGALTAWFGPFPAEPAAQN